MARRIFGAAALFLLAMIGASVAIIDAEIPASIVQETGLNDQTLKLLSLLNNTLMIAIAVIIGTLTAHRVGLTSLIAHRIDGRAARLTVFPIYAVLGVVFGLAVAGLDHWALSNIEALRSFSEAAGQQIQGATPTVATRFLYGGITEEILLRWGMLSLFAWMIWAVTKNRGLAFLIAIPLAGLLFGAGHLPTLYATFETVPVEMVIRVILLNAFLGIAYGVIYARNSLEAAMVTHAATHVGLLSAANLLS